MIENVFALAAQNPNDAVSMLKNQASSAGRVAGHALGMTAEEIDEVASRGLPTPIVAVAFFGIGALLAMRYAPEAWIGKVRRFGR